MITHHFAQALSVKVPAYIVNCLMKLVKSSDSTDVWNVSFVALSLAMARQL
jgi:hypothetical protein